MNNNIEIRVWANHSDFEEITRQAAMHLLTQDYLTRFAPDQFRFISCENYYSVFFAPTAVCLNLHTCLYSPKLRDSRVVITIAVRHGYRLSNATEAFAYVKQEFTNFINDRSLFPDNDNVNGIHNHIVKRVEQWEDGIDTIADDEQIIITPTEQRSIAFVPFANADEFSKLIAYPAREQFADYMLVFFAPQEETDGFAKYIKLQGITPEYRPQYKVFFPDYQSAPIAVISSMDDTISVNCQKTYYEPMLIEGTLRDCQDLWKVSRSQDRRSYSIGLKLKAEERTYNVCLKNRKKGTTETDSNLLSKFEIGRSDSTGFVAIGSFDTKKAMLTLTGSECAYSSSLQARGKSQEYDVRSCRMEGDTLTIEYEQLFRYDIAALRQKLKDLDSRNNKNGIASFEPVICVNGKEVRDQQWWTGSINSYEIMVTDPAKRYRDYRFPMSTPLNTLKLTKNEGTKITFVWDSTMRVDAKHPLTLSLDENKKHYIDHFCQEEEFHKHGKYKVELKGYKPDDIDINERSRKIEYISLQPTFPELMRQNILVIVLCIMLLLVGLAGGYVLGSYMPADFATETNVKPADKNKTKDNDKGKPQKPAQYNTADDATNAQADKIAEPQEAKQAAEPQAAEPQTDKAAAEKEAEQAAAEKEAADKAAAEKEAAEKEAAKQRQKLAKAINKLHSVNFDNETIKAAEKLATELKNQDALKTCAACDKALKFCGGKKDAKDLENFLKSDLAKALPDQPKNALSLIVNDKVMRSAYVTNTNSYSTIEKLQKALQD